MFKVKLTKVISNHNRMRTDSMEGRCDTLPEWGKNFLMIGTPLDSKEAIRFLQTSLVKSIPVRDFKNDEVVAMEFETENSRYRLEVLSEEE